MDQLVNGLYTQFVLRDFMGRIVPGSVFFLLIALGFVSPPEIHAFAKEMPQAYWAILGGVAWTAGSGLQLMWNWVLDARRNIDEEIETKECNTAATADEQAEEGSKPWRISRAVSFDKQATPPEKMRRERYVVVRHAAGTLCTALLFGVLLCAIIDATQNDPSRIGQYKPHLIWIIPLAILSGAVSQDEWRSQKAFEDKVLAGKETVLKTALTTVRE